MESIVYINSNKNPSTDLSGWIDNNRESVEKEEKDKGEENFYEPVLILEKCANQCAAVVGDMITYTVIATNKGRGPRSISVEDVKLYNLLPSGLKFIKDSVILDNKPMIGESLLRGINIGTIYPNQTKILTFKAEVVGEEKGWIINSVTGEYRYHIPGKNKQVCIVESNAYHLKVCNASLKLIKTADVEEVNLGDMITYTVELINDGNLTAYNIAFTDQLPPEVELIPESFKIGHEHINGVELGQGITIPFIPPCHKSVIRYRVKVVGSNCSGRINNEARAEFEYHLPDGTIGNLVVIGPENTVTVQLNRSIFKEINVESYLMIPEVKPSIESINTIKGVIDCIGYHVINTIEATNVERQQLTGYKLIVKGNLTIAIEYTALNEIQSIHSTWYTVPFSTFIILPSTYKLGSKIEVEGIIEDIHCNAIDIRNFAVNVTTLMNVKILSC